MRRALKILAFLLLIAPLAGWYLLEHVLPYAAVCPYRTTGETFYAAFPLGMRPENYGLEAEEWTARSRDSLLLRAWFVPARPDSSGSALSGTIILLHGIGGCRGFMLPGAAWLSQLGFDVLVPDLRAQGASEGRYCTFGFYEKNDVSVWIDTLLARRPAGRLGIYGNSLGGAIALQALSADARLGFGVVESTFHDLESVVAAYGRRYVGVESRWLARQVLARAARLARFEPDSVRPYRDAEHIHQPVFMAHGTADERIPYGFGRQNFEHLAGTTNTWYEVPGAGHVDLWQKGGDAYRRALEEFLRQHAGLTRR
jgi:pimeloyl-ACP methyl ester carboxylesterase